MRAVIQRVSSARVEVDGAITGEIGRGLMVLLGVSKQDQSSDVQWMVDKIAGLRIFEDEAGKMNRSVQDINGGLLVVSQFTLYGDTRKGRRPSFDQAAPAETARALYEEFVTLARATTGLAVGTGIFQAHMHVSLCNDGPVTLICESPNT
jgi:D-aminoacyl-tRNA deacylase